MPLRISHRLQLVRQCKNLCIVDYSGLQLCTNPLNVVPEKASIDCSVDYRYSNDGISHLIPSRDLDTVACILNRRNEGVRYG